MSLTFNLLLLADLHLTSNPRDEYRWKVFDWLIGNMSLHSVKYLIILGDLTESKDYHSSKLVNRLVDKLLTCYREGGLHKIYVLPGNHDGLDPNCPYFRFLGQYPSIHYVNTIWMEEIAGENVLFLPHTKDPLTTWRNTDMEEAGLIFCHQTFKGSKAETGTQLDGVPTGVFRRAVNARIWSGDIHVPQKVDRVEYVGAPYHVRFGDAFKGRAVLIEKGRVATTLEIPSIQRVSITFDPNSDDPNCSIIPQRGDQVKIRIRLAPHEYGDWQKIKNAVVEQCAEDGLEVCGVELEKVTVTKKVVIQPRNQKVVQTRSRFDIFDEYCALNKITDDVKDFGSVVLEGEGSGNAQKISNI